MSFTRPMGILNGKMGGGGEGEEGGVGGGDLRWDDEGEGSSSNEEGRDGWGG